MTDLEKRISNIKFKIQMSNTVSLGDTLFLLDQLEKHQKVLDEATQALNYYKETRDEKLFPYGISSNFKSKDRAEIALEKIDQILNGGDING